MAAERVQKILAQVGIASRRKAEELIAQGLVTINGKVAQLGDKADSMVDAIKVEGKLLQAPLQPIYLALHKPRGVISALSDPEGRPTIVNLLDKLNTRVFPIGNLEFNADGLLILTNDGGFANELQNRGDVPWVYHVKVKGEMDHEMVGRIEAGAKINHRLIKPFSVRVAEKLEQKTKLEVVLLGPGGNELKTLFEMRGFLVEKITRTAIGQLTLHGLESGHYKMLKKSQVEAVLKQPELGLRRLEQAAEKAEEKEYNREKGRISREKVERAKGRFGTRRAPRDGQGAPTSEGRDDSRPDGRSAERTARFGSRGPSAPRAFGGPPKPFGGRSPRITPRTGDVSERAPAAPRSEGAYGIQRPKFSGGADRDERPRSNDRPTGPRRESSGYNRDRGEGKESRGPSKFSREGRAPRAAGSYEGAARGPRSGAGKFGGSSDRPSRGPSKFGSERPRTGGAGFGGGSDRPSRGPSKFGSERPRTGGAGFGGGSDRPSRGPSKFGSERPRTGGRPSSGGGFGGNRGPSKRR